MNAPARPALIALLTILSLLISSAALAATAPHEENFNDGTADGFSTAGTTGAYALQSESSGQSYRATLAASTGAQSASAGLSISGLAATSCVISTDFTITSLTANGSSIVNGGLALFSNTADFSTGTQYRLYYQVTNGTVGKLQLMRNGTSLAFSSGSLVPRLNVKYTLSAIITYSEGSITIQGLLYDDANTLSVTVIDNSPLPGTYFGYRTAISTANVSTALTIKYDNFEALFGTGAAPGDGTVTGNLSVGGSVAIAGNTLTLGESGTNPAASFVYNPATADFSSLLTSATGTWSWQRNGGLGMALDAQNRLSLIGEDGVTPDIYLTPRGVSEIKALHVKENLSVGGSLRIAPQGDLSMGDFDEGTDPAL